MIFRVAGSDTTAAAARACFYYVIKNPRVYQALVAEIDRADKEGRLSPFVTYKEFLELPYLYVSLCLYAYIMNTKPATDKPLSKKQCESIPALAFPSSESFLKEEP